MWFQVHTKKSCWTDTASSVFPPPHCCLRKVHAASDLWFVQKVILPDLHTMESSFVTVVCRKVIHHIDTSVPERRLRNFFLVSGLIESDELTKVAVHSWITFSRGRGALNASLRDWGKRTTWCLVFWYPNHVCFKPITSLKRKEYPWMRFVSVHVT